MIDVAAVGSLHLDIMVAAPRLPGRDETLIGSAWSTKCGGKGGNQAVAAARFGARVAFGGRTGGDDFGERLRANLVAAGVDIACVETDPTQGSGMSVAIMEMSGEYGAVVVSGANLGIDAQSIARKWNALWQCKVLLLQNEIPEAVNIAAATEARKAGAQIVFNAAPARLTSGKFLDLVDVMIVNRVEAAMLAGTDDMAKAIQALHTASLDVVLTRGADGLTVMTRQGHIAELPALAVRMISSHGAGDCFCGALAARLAVGDPLLEACAYARTAAGLFVSLAEGSQSSLTHAVVASHAGQP